MMSCEVHLEEFSLTLGRQEMRDGNWYDKLCFIGSGKRTFMYIAAVDKPVQR